MLESACFRPGNSFRHRHLGTLPRPVPPNTTCCIVNIHCLVSYPRPSHPVDCSISHAYLQRLHVWAGKCKACKHCGINITAQEKVSPSRREVAARQRKTPLTGQSRAGPERRSGTRRQGRANSAQKKMRKSRASRLLIWIRTRLPSPCCRQNGKCARMAGSIASFIGVRANDQREEPGRDGGSARSPICLGRTVAPLTANGGEHSTPRALPDQSRA